MSTQREHGNSSFLINMILLLTFVTIMQSHQAPTGAQIFHPVDFRKVPGHGKGPQPGLRVPEAPEGGKRARKCKKRKDEGVYKSVKNPADLVRAMVSWAMPSGTMILNFTYLYTTHIIFFFFW